MLPYNTNNRPHRGTKRSGPASPEIVPSRPSRKQRTLQLLEAKKAKRLAALAAPPRPTTERRPTFQELFSENSAPTFVPDTNPDPMKLRFAAMIGLEAADLVNIEDNQVNTTLLSEVVAALGRSKRNTRVPKAIWERRTQTEEVNIECIPRSRGIPNVNAIHINGEVLSADRYGLIKSKVEGISAKLQRLPKELALHALQYTGLSVLAEALANGLGLDPCYESTPPKNRRGGGPPVFVTTTTDGNILLPSPGAYKSIIAISLSGLGVPVSWNGVDVRVKLYGEVEDAGYNMLKHLCDAPSDLVPPKRELQESQLVETTGPVRIHTTATKDVALYRTEGCVAVYHPADSQVADQHPGVHKYYLPHENSPEHVLVVSFLESHKIPKSSHNEMVVAAAIKFKRGVFCGAFPAPDLSGPTLVMNSGQLVALRINGGTPGMTIKKGSDTDRDVSWSPDCSMSHLAAMAARRSPATGSYPVHSTLEGSTEALPQGAAVKGLDYKRGGPIVGSVATLKIAQSLSQKLINFNLSIHSQARTREERVTIGGARFWSMNPAIPGVVKSAWQAKTDYMLSGDIIQTYATGSYEPTFTRFKRVGHGEAEHRLNTMTEFICRLGQFEVPNVTRGDCQPQGLVTEVQIIPYEPLFQALRCGCSTKAQLQAAISKPRGKRRREPPATSLRDYAPCPGCARKRAYQVNYLGCARVGEYVVMHCATVEGTVGIQLVISRVRDPIKRSTMSRIELSTQAMSLIASLDKEMKVNERIRRGLVSVKSVTGHLSAPTLPPWLDEQPRCSRDPRKEMANAWHLISSLARVMPDVPGGARCLATPGQVAAHLRSATEPVRYFIHGGRLMYSQGGRYTLYQRLVAAASYHTHVIPPAPRKPLANVAPAPAPLSAPPPKRRRGRVSRAQLEALDEESDDDDDQSSLDDENMLASG